jgi:hypothetical protein
MRWGGWRRFGECENKSRAVHFSLDGADHWPLQRDISKGNQVRLREIRQMSISHKILNSLIPAGGRNLSEAEISALSDLNVTVPDGSRVHGRWHNGECVSHFMGNVWRPTKRGFKSTHILVSQAA